ncbi:MAG: glycosyltransferase family 9 protein [candidate division KSB1 bacterium]|nr:glycosyltransferase family 9 protein [candidate division KSB1 bacterium]
MKFLVIRFSSIGDILLTTPLLRSLRQTYPRADIGFAIKEQFAPLLQHNPHINRMHTLKSGGTFKNLKSLKSEIRSHDYDVVIDIHNNLRSRYTRAGLGVKHYKYKKYKWKRFWLVHTRLNFYRRIIPVHLRYIQSIADFGVKDDGQGLELSIPESMQHQMNARLTARGFDQTRLTVGVAAGAGFPTKRWPADRFTAVCQQLQAKHKAQILLFGDKNDRSLTQRIQEGLQEDVWDLAGYCTLTETAAAMRNCDLLLCNDTGLMHMATALCVKVAAIFGCTTRELGFFPINGRIIEHPGLACRPCTHMGRRHCPKGHFRCMLDLSVNDVYQAAAAQLKAT